MGENWGFIFPEMLGAELLPLLAFFILWWDSTRRYRHLSKLMTIATLESVESGLRCQRRGGIIAVIGLSLAIVGASGPYCGTRKILLEAAGVNIVCVVDLSASMNATDYLPSRLDVARVELGCLLERLKGQRIGLVGFAGMPATLMPLTVDYTALQMALEGLSTSTIPVPGTAIGDGLRVAIERLGRAGGVIILLSDGEDHHSDPIAVAKIAAQRRVPIVCIGIGTEKGSTIPDEQENNHQNMRDERGKVITSRLDVATLREIASITKGIYMPMEAGNERNIETIVQVVRDSIAREQARQEAKSLGDISAVFICISILAIFGGLYMRTNGKIMVAQILSDKVS